MTVGRTFVPNEKHGVAFSDWSDCETKRLEINHEAKMAISTQTMMKEWPIEAILVATDIFGVWRWLPTYFDVLGTNMKIESVQLFQGKIDWSIIS
ncbi:hypothetical protein THAOC_36039 [Thalassiosira oceanica]|uniref:Uncharacterized protein n=1 Tax=Thalassiosira oceanica TaxID=159749 RepID=K0RFJ3_THAOC|nr:hypothetical protein THAOC_36039 [Thalassiosira oceanica]|eukprot:EJK45347.1 hypothetical protein THAOC_36039 [Thalassiosira oceanica]